MEPSRFAGANHGFMDALFGKSVDRSCRRCKHSNGHLHRQANTVARRSRKHELAKLSRHLNYHKAAA